MKEIRDCLKNNIKHGQKYAIMGVGSELRSDDAAGMYFIDLFGKKVQRDDILLIAGSTAPENFTGVIKAFAPDKLFIIDAAHIGLLPGELKIIPACDIGGVSFSTHMLPLSFTLNYLESEAKCDTIFIGIQPKYTDQGFTMCQEVTKGIRSLVKEFCGAFKALQPE